MSHVQVFDWVLFLVHPVVVVWCHGSRVVFRCGGRRVVVWCDSSRVVVRCGGIRAVVWCDGSRVVVRCGGSREWLCGVVLLLEESLP